MENYVEAKKRIFDYAKWAYISRDDEYSKVVSSELCIPHKTIASQFKNYPADIWIDAGGMLHKDGALFDCNELETIQRSTQLAKCCFGICFN